MKKIKETLILSFALFAMFFGASNVILPSYIGLRVGDSFSLAALGFILTGVGLPLLGLLVVIRNEGDYLSLFKPMGKWFSKIFLLLAFLSIGPIIAIPRTAATTFEIGVKPLFPNATSLIVTLIYFLICIYFSINENKVTNEVGKILTPLLLIGLVVLIISGLFNNNIANYELVESKPFNFAFLEGYNTLDAIASIIFARIIYISVKKQDNPMRTSIIATLIAALGLGLVYMGIMYLGNTVYIENAITYDRTEHIIKIAQILLGNKAKIVLSMIISFACLTTSIGLIASVSEFFEGITKLKYKYVVIIISFVSFLISQLKVDRIINLAIPILMVFYPVLIVIILLNLLKGRIINDKVICSATYTALVVAILDQLKLGIIKYIPFSNIGMAWLIPTLIVIVVTIILFNVKSDSYGK